MAIYCTKQPVSTLTLKLNDAVVVSDSDTLILSLGIELGKMAPNSIIEPVKNVGCAKVLGVG